MQIPVGGIEMEYANSLSGFKSAFKLGPLEADELGRFYCDGTMEFRTGDKCELPIQDIYEACKEPSATGNAFLLLGHHGCGKSTELNKMSATLASDGYQVCTVRCASDIDLMNPLYTDILVLMGEALLMMADEAGCEISADICSRLLSFWGTEIEQNYTATSGAALSMEAGAKAGTPLFKAILDAFAEIKANIKFSKEKQMTYKEKITPRASEWLAIVNGVAGIITERLGWKQPIMIFEDLDKITNHSAAWDIFSINAATLTGVSFPVIYTFPIALFYDPRFTSLRGYYEDKTLPMIKQETVDGMECREGTDVIKAIVGMRAALGLFEDDVDAAGDTVLETLAKKTGGSLRDLFQCIVHSARRAMRRGAARIARDDINVALEVFKSSLTRRIEKKHYGFLASIYNGYRRGIDDKGMLLEMLQAEAVLEFNATRWHNVHPLVADFLKDIGEI